MLFPHLGAKQSIPFVVAQPNERNANRTATTVLEWYDKHRAYIIWFKRRRRLLNFDEIVSLLTITVMCIASPMLGS